MNRVYIVEDESFLRELYYDYFPLALPEFDLVRVAEEDREALRECKRLRPDVILLDITLPKISGLKLLKILKRLYPEIKVGFYTGSACLESIKEAVNGGADGFIEKSGGMEQMKTALRALFSGEKYYSPNVLKQINLFKSSDLLDAPMAS